MLKGKKLFLGPMPPVGAPGGGSGVGGIIGGPKIISDRTDSIDDFVTETKVAHESNAGGPNSETGHDHQPENPPKVIPTRSDQPKSTVPEPASPPAPPSPPPPGSSQPGVIKPDTAGSGTGAPTNVDVTTSSNSFTNSLLSSLRTTTLLNTTSESLKSNSSKNRNHQRTAAHAHQQDAATRSIAERATIANVAMTRSTAHSAHNRTVFNTLPNHALGEIFRDAARQTPQAQSGERATKVFQALRDANTLALPTERNIGAQNDSRFSAGVAGTLTPDEGSRLINNTLQALITRQLSPQDILRAFALVQTQFLGIEWFMQGSRDLMQLLSLGSMDSRAALAGVLAEHLTQTIASRMASIDGQNAQRVFLLAQLTAIASDPDLLARLFAGIPDGKERLSFLHELAQFGLAKNLTDSAKDDAFAALLNAISAREGSSRLPGAVNNFDQLRAEVLQFAATQNNSLYFQASAAGPQFHTPRMEGILQCIIQHLMRDFTRHQMLSPQLRRRHGSSIDLLSSLLELLEQDSEDAQHEDDADEDALNQEGDLGDDTDGADNWDAALQIRYSFRVEPRQGNEVDEPMLAKVTWAKCENALQLDLPARFDSRSPLKNELSALQDACLQEQFFAEPHRPPAASGDLLREVIRGNDGVYSLGSAAVGETLLARQWTCKMWAHDLADRVSAEGAHTKPFPFEKTYQQLRTSTGAIEAHPGSHTTPRSVDEMRLDMLRMLGNSADDWARRFAGDLLEKHLKAQTKAPQEQADVPTSMRLTTAPTSSLAQPPKAIKEFGEFKQIIQIPEVRNAAIYFLAQYYFRLEQRERRSHAANAA
jgi:hypothetical protein